MINMPPAREPVVFNPAFMTPDNHAANATAASMSARKWKGYTREQYQRLAFLSTVRSIRSRANWVMVNGRWACRGSVLRAT